MDILHAPAKDRFQEQYRRKPSGIRAVVVHETAGASKRAAIDTMKLRGLGVHYIIDSDGTVTEHASSRAVVYHAGPAWNRVSMGIEIVNPVMIENAPEDRMHEFRVREIKAAWLSTKRYVMPAQEQLVSLYELVDLLVAPRGEIENTFPASLDGGPPSLGRCRDFEHKYREGIVHHSAWNHEDGAFPCLYLWFRRAKKMTHEQALSAAIANAENANGSVVRV